MAHHRVTYDPLLHRIIKLSGDHPGAAQELAYERTAYALQGIETQPYREGFTMPYLGASCEPWSSSDNEALEAMWDVLAAVRATGLPPIESWGQRVHDKIIHRVPPGRLRHDLITSLNDVDMSVLTGDRLVHTDPHPGNIVRQHDGSLTLIDWETSFSGHPDITRACWLTIQGENSHPVTRTDHSVGVLKSASMASMTYHLSTSVDEALHTWSKHRPTASH